VLETIHRFHQPDVPFLDEIEHGESAIDVAPRDRDDEAQVGLEQIAPRVVEDAVAFADQHVLRRKRRGQEARARDPRTAHLVGRRRRGGRQRETVALEHVEVRAQLVHERGPQRQRGQHLRKLRLGARNRRFPRSREAPRADARRDRPAPLRDARRQPAHARERAHEARRRRGRDLAALMRQDQVARHRRFRADAIGQCDQHLHRRRHPRQLAHERAARGFDALRDRLFLVRRQQPALADAVEVDADEIDVLAAFRALVVIGGRRIVVVRQAPGGLTSRSSSDSWNSRGVSTSGASSASRSVSLSGCSSSAGPGRATGSRQGAPDVAMRARSPSSH
jgi:hypothetical protein